MPADTKKYPLYIYNEPASYNQFNGGINTDPSNEGLLINELRNGINIDYFNETPRKRKGAQKLLEMVYTEDIQKIQGVFLFTLLKPYIFVLGDGKIYYSLYYPNRKLTLKELRINYSEPYQSILKYLGLKEYNSLIDQIDHDGYVLKDGLEEYLIFQNKRKVEATSYNNKVYIATGTRLVSISLVDKKLKAEIVQPYEPNGIEYQNIGTNLLSPYPEHHIKVTEENLVKTQIHFIKVTQQDNDGNYLFEAVMSYAAGKEPSDYYFKWEIMIGGVAKPVGWPDTPVIYAAGISGSQWVSRGRQSVAINYSEFKGEKVRCTFYETFKEGTEQVIINSDESYQDWIPDKVAGGWFGSATSTPALKVGKPTNETWRIIQSCTKILSDGNKFLLYGDDYQTGEWFKTVIDNPGYMTYRGGLGFKTNKNEELIKIIHFKGMILAFAYSPYTGGNISMVLGDGDDYNDGSNQYSPYYRKIIYNDVTTDNADSVRVAENIVIFKYKTNVYMIQGSEYSTDIFSIQTVNSKLLNKTQDVNIPWEDNDCISEITNDYYALIWNEVKDLENDEVVIVRPGMRVKMYFKNGYQQGNQVFFPWLIDKGKYFNTTHILEIEGISTHIYNNLLIQYTDSAGMDLGEEYESFLRLRAVDLNYPKFTKYLSSTIIYYQRGFKEPLNFTIRCYNEAGYLLLTAQIIDDKAFFEGQNITKARLGSSVIETKIINTKHKFPALLIDTLIFINGTSDFALGSITFNYTAVTTPDINQPDQYRKIIRVGEPMVITRESFLPKINEVEADQITIINAGGADEDYK